ncbi:hypothetical protein Droror1_Dr00013511 [Drosera rotundifolia]
MLLHLTTHLRLLSPKPSLFPFRQFSLNPHTLSSLKTRSRSLYFYTAMKGKRNKSTDVGKGSSLMVEESDGSGFVGFNRKRAEGRDGSEKPKVLNKRVRTLNPTSTICYVQVLGTGMDTQDTSPSVLLFFDKQRYLFNAGEGLQRFFTEHKIKLSKIDQIFLSRVCSETAGGLPGLLLTLAGMGEEAGLSVNIEGPSDLKYLVNAMKSFIPSAAMVHTKSFGPSTKSIGTPPTDPQKLSEPIKLVENEVVKISAILLEPCCHNSESTAVGPPQACMTKETVQFSESWGTNGKPGSMRKPGDLSVIYVCELSEIPGKFDPQKAKDLGLRPGPKYGLLQKNESVQSDLLDIMVHPNDVMDPAIPGPIVLIVDCPTTSHLQYLLNMDSLSTYFRDASGNPSGSESEVTCVIHLSPSSVASMPEYERWMKRLDSAQHIMAGHQARNVQIPILKSSARLAARLNYLCPQFFPASGFWPAKCTENESYNSSSSEGLQYISAENLMKFKLRPYTSLGVDKACIPVTMRHEEVISELCLETPEIVNAAQQIMQSLNSSRDLSDCMLPGCLEDITREDMEIVLLGTGSSQPSKYRNVTSIYFDLFSKGSLLFDCGEGTLGQLKRRFGVEGADDAVKKLRFIWISHIHADHHSGLARVLALRRDLLKGVPHEQLPVVGPPQLKVFLDAYQKLEDLDMQFLDCRHTTEAAWDAFERSCGPSDGQSSPSSHTNSEDTRISKTCDANATLFATGSPMLSYFKKTNVPTDHSMAFPLLTKLQTVLHEAGLESVVSFRVVHCPNAFGVSLQAAQRSNRVGKLIPGWKIVYSGDTRPCKELVEASCGATVLIHEATFEDGMLDEAIAKNHSTTIEAIEAGNAAGVYRTILTHFSQRYAKIPVFDETHMHNTCIGFDLMSINLTDLPVVPKILPYLKLLFKDEIVVDESDDFVEDIGAAAP